MESNFANQEQVTPQQIEMSTVPRRIEVIPSQEMETTFSQIGPVPSRIEKSSDSEDSDDDIDAIVEEFQAVIEDLPKVDEDVIVQTEKYDHAFNLRFAKQRFVKSSLCVGCPEGWCRVYMSVCPPLYISIPRPWSRSPPCSRP